jgi:phosphatidylglycerophosphatase A
MSADSDTAAPSISDASRSAATAQRKPRLALFIATACGLGYIPVAPGTWGSLGGILLYFAVQVAFPPTYFPGLRKSFEVTGWSAAWAGIPITVVIAALGVWSATTAARFWNVSDPQRVVIDEVSGQHMTYLLAFAPLNWKYLLLGFILFRVFDIWKPSPARQAESLPGGWGIMADDWVAGIYAAIGLWLARAAGL